MRKEVRQDVRPKRRHDGGMADSVSEVGYDGKWWWWKCSKTGLKNSYGDEQKFRYSLAQEMASLQDASRLVDVLLRDFRGKFAMKKWFYVCPGCGQRTECHVVRWSSIPRFISHKDREGEHCRWSGFEIPKNPIKEEWGMTAAEPIHPYSGHIRSKPDYGEVEPDIEKRMEKMVNVVASFYLEFV